LKINTDTYITALHLRSNGNYWDYSQSLRDIPATNLKKGSHSLIASELKIPDSAALIISAEDFVTLDKNQIEIFRSFFKDGDFEFHLIYFLRHQPESLVGLYQTQLTYYPDQVDNFEQFLTNQKDCFKYDEIIECWDSVFNFTSINLLDYIDSKIGKPVNSIHEFSSILNKILNTQIELNSTEMFNRGVGAITLRWLDQLHLPFGPKIPDEVVSFLSSLDPKTEKQMQFLTKKEYTSLRKEFAKNNNNIYKRFKLKLTEPSEETKSVLLNSRPKFGELFEQLITSNSALLKSLTSDPRIRVIDEDKGYLNPYTATEFSKIKESVALSLVSPQVVDSTFVPKFPSAVERTRDGSNEKSDITNHLFLLDLIKSVVDGASKILHLGCKWGYMTRLLFSLGDNVEVHCSDLQRDWVTTIRMNSPFAQTFFLDDDCSFPYKDDFSDIVIADHSFVSYLGEEKLEKYLREISRVLCSGGYAFFNSISMATDDVDLAMCKIDSPLSNQRNGGIFVFNAQFLIEKLPPKIEMKSFVTNSVFDFYVLQKASDR
jgi:hypothetical protein